MATAVAAGGMILFIPEPASAAVILDPCPTLTQGYHGGCINELQIELNEDIGTTLAIDGYFGPDTYNAVVAFQQKAGVPADGMVGLLTKAALDVLNSVATPGPGAPLSPNQAQQLVYCLASTASTCVPPIHGDDGGIDTIGKARDLYKQQLMGEEFPMPGEPVLP